MQVILYMAPTVNGTIAGENDDTGFVSETEWKSFRNMVKRTGNIIVGRRTYEVMQKSGQLTDFDKIKIIVMTHNTSLKSDNLNIIFTNQAPKGVLQLLQKQGFNEALVAGGGKLNASFMKEGLIDEIFLDIEPVILGGGIKLFSDGSFEAGLKLIGVNKLSADEIQLHYKVKK